MTHVSIHHENIAKMMGELQASFDSNGPIRVAIEAEAADGFGTAVAVPTTINNYNGDGPVIYGNSAQVAYGNQNVNQIQLSELSPPTRAVAEAVAKVLQLLPQAGLTAEEQQEASTAGQEVLAEVGQPEQDEGRIKRALMMFKGYLAPVASRLTTAAVAGVLTGEQQSVQAAIEHLVQTHI